MAFEAPNESEISARLHRAIAPSLSSSCQHDPTPLPTPPSSLSDLLLLLSAYDSPRCPHCRSPLPFGAHSQLCLVCSSPLHHLPPPSFSSSVPFRRLLHALQIDGLEADFHDSEAHLSEEIFSEEDYSVSESDPGKSKALSNSDKSITRPDFSEDSISPTLVTANTPITVDAVNSIETANLMIKHEEKPLNILDYAANLEGVPLEDFFNNPVSSRVTHIQESDTIVADTLKSSDKRNLFSDPLTVSVDSVSDDLIPNIHNATDNINGALIINSSNNAPETFAFTEEEDTFSSWEGAFQSAKPSGGELSGNSWFETQVSSTNGEVGKHSLENSFEETELDNEDDEWASNWVAAASAGNDDIFGLKVTENTDNTSLFSGKEQAKYEDNLLFPSNSLQVENLNSLTTPASTQQIQPVVQSDDVIDFFESTWQDNSETLVSSAVFNNDLTLKPDEQELVQSDDVIDFFKSSWQDNSETLVSSAVFNNDLTLKLDEQELVYPSVLATGMPIADSRHDSTVVGNDFGQQKASNSREVLEKDVGFLLAQLHDLSFMLSDGLVIK